MVRHVVRQRVKAMASLQGYNAEEVYGFILDLAFITYRDEELGPLVKLIATGELKEGSPAPISTLRMNETLTRAMPPVKKTS